MTEKDQAALETLEAKLKAARGKSDAERGGLPGRMPWESSQTGFAFRISIELVVGIAVGLGIGWAIDGWLGTRPLFMIVFMILGLTAGILNVVRITKRMDAAEARKADPGKETDPGGAGSGGGRGERDGTRR